MDWGLSERKLAGSYRAGSLTDNRRERRSMSAWQVAVAVITGVPMCGYFVHAARDSQLVGRFAMIYRVARRPDSVGRFSSWTRAVAIGPVLW